MQLEKYNNLNNKPLGFGSVIILDEMGQSSMTESEGNSLSLYVLLSDTGNDLQRMRSSLVGEGGGSHTWEILIFDPFDPDTTIALKLLNSDNDFCAEDPVLSRASFRIRLTCNIQSLSLPSSSYEFNIPDSRMSVLANFRALVQVHHCEPCEGEGLITFSSIE